MKPYSDRMDRGSGLGKGLALVAGVAILAASPSAEAFLFGLDVGNPLKGGVSGLLTHPTTPIQEVNVKKHNYFNWKGLFYHSYEPGIPVTEAPCPDSHGLVLDQDRMPRCAPRVVPGVRAVRGMVPQQGGGYAQPQMQQPQMQWVPMQVMPRTQGMQCGPVQPETGAVYCVPVPSGQVYQGVPSQGGGHVALPYTPPVVTYPSMTAPPAAPRVEPQAPAATEARNSLPEPAAEPAPAPAVDAPVPGVEDPLELPPIPGPA